MRVELYITLEMLTLLRSRGSKDMNFNFHSRTTYSLEGEHVLLERSYSPPTILHREYDFNEKAPCIREARYIADHCVELLPAKTFQDVEPGELQRAYEKFIAKGGITEPLENLLNKTAPKLKASLPLIRAEKSGPSRHPGN